MEIELKNGMKAIIDDEDYELVKDFTWYPWRSYGNWYVKATRNRGGKFTTYLMHRVIMGAKKGEIIDHINGNGLDNRRCNLRFCTHSQNNWNRHRTWGASKYKGVRKERERWKAVIRKFKKDHYLGTFDSQFLAALAYDQAALRMFGEFAQPNFPWITTSGDGIERLYEDLEGADALALEGADRRPWLVVMPLETLLEIAEAKEASA